MDGNCAQNPATKPWVAKTGTNPLSDRIEKSAMARFDHLIKSVTINKQREMILTKEEVTTDQIIFSLQ